MVSYKSLLYSIIAYLDFFQLKSIVPLGSKVLKQFHGAYKYSGEITKCLLL